MAAGDLQPVKQQVNGVELYYERHGDPVAPAVVLINGITQDTTSWAAAVRDLSPHFYVLAYDCRGQGQSDKPETGPYLPGLHARDLAALLDALGIGRAHFVGLSNGGIVLQHFARLYPERLGRIVLAETCAFNDGVQRAMLESWRIALRLGGSEARFMIALPWVWGAAFLEKNLDTVLALREKAARLPVYSTLHLIDGADTHDSRDWLGTLQAEALVLHADQDRMMLPYHAHYLHAHLPHARLHIIEGAGHAAWIEKASEFNRCVLEFLQT